MIRSERDISHSGKITTTKEQSTEWGNGHKVKEKDWRYWGEHMQVHRIYQ